MYFHLSKVTRVHKANDSRERYKFNKFHYFGCFLDFIPVDRAEIPRMNRTQNLSRNRASPVTKLI